MRSFLVVMLSLFAAACGPPSIESLCDDAAAAQCETCLSCEVDDAAGLCGMPAGTTQADCEEELAARCVDQAATIEQPKKELETCSDSLGELTCQTLIDAAAQDTSYTTDECSYFL